MSFKRRVLSVLGKDLLLEIGRGLELQVTSRMTVEELRDTLARSKRATFAAALGKLSFDVTTPSIEDAFVRIYAIKNSKKPDAKLVLQFRGAT